MHFIIILLCCIKSKACNLQIRFLLPDVTIHFSFFKGQTLWKELLEGRIMLKRLTNSSFGLCIFYKVLNLFERICLCGYFIALFNHVSFSCFRNNCLTLILKISSMFQIKKEMRRRKKTSKMKLHFKCYYQNIYHLSKVNENVQRSQMKILLVYCIFFFLIFQRKKSEGSLGI